MNHFLELKRQGVVTAIHELKEGEHEFGSNFVDGITTGAVFIAPPNYQHLPLFVRDQGRKPILLELVNNSAFGSVRCSTTSFYAAGELANILHAQQAARYIL